MFLSWGSGNSQSSKLDTRGRIWPVYFFYAASSCKADGSTSAAHKGFVLPALLLFAVIAVPFPAVGLVEVRYVMNVDQVHALGFTGTGVTVAILDTGIDTDHPDLADDLIGEQCFCLGGCCPGGLDTSASAEDDNGHGTYMAGIITSNGVVAPLGVAPDAEIVAIKIMDNAGNWSFWNVENALQWIIDTQPDVEIVNMSFGYPANFYSAICDNDDPAFVPIRDRISILGQRGVAFFGATGNGCSSQGIAFPSCLSDVISVGAVWDGSVLPVDDGCELLPSVGLQDDVARFSNTSIDTDLLAPGVWTTTTALNGQMNTVWGTSEANAATTGCAALLRERDPNLSPLWLEAILEFTGFHVTDDRSGLLFPRVDCAQALEDLAPEPVFNPDTGNYYEIVLKSLIWPDAKVEAENRLYDDVPGHLATISSQEENDFLYNLATPPCCTRTGYHIGLNDIAIEGAFEWVTGEPLEFTNWASGEPNDQGNAEDIAIMWWNNTWDDARADYALPGFYVEYDVPEPGAVVSLLSGMVLLICLHRRRKNAE